SLKSRVVPMSDDQVRSRFFTDRGTLSLQEYFVRERLEPALRAIDFDGLEAARLSPAASAALHEAELVVIGPSNPLLSIDPVLECDTVMGDGGARLARQILGGST